MLASSRNSSTKKVNDSPFDVAILADARKIAAQYRYIVDFEDGEYFGSTIEMPFVMADGPTMEAAIAATREATVVAVATLLESGKGPPSPASEEKRTEQVNMRLTRNEKFLFEEAASRRGFRGVSDFVRSAAMKEARSGE